MTVADRVITGVEAAEVYGRRLHALRADADRDRRRRETILNALRRLGGKASIAELQEQAGLDITGFLPVMADLLEDGHVLAHGAMLVLPESPASTP